MKLYLIGKPRLEWTAFAEFARDEGLPQAEQYMIEPPSDGETIAEVAGRICYMSFGRGRRTNAEYLGHIISQGHFSVLEHANWTFIITGVSRSLTHELVRHRHFSFSQLSQRYVDHVDAKFIVPDKLADTGLADEWQAYVYTARALYAKLSESLEHSKVSTAERKRIHGMARSVLPEATETKLVITGNARTWREFIQKRASAAADAEIRTLAGEILKALVREAPSMFGDLTEAV